jgi:Flp pilus assembly protein TadB
VNTHPENDRSTRSQGGQPVQSGQSRAGTGTRPPISQQSLRTQQAQQAAQAQRARQVFAGNDLRAPENPLDFGAPEGLVDSTQRTYLIVLFGLLVVAVLLYFLFGMGPASPIFFILALSLIAGWLVF